MKITINPISDKLTDIFQEFGKIIDFSVEKDREDKLIQLSGKYGRGSIWYREVINGMGLVIVKNLKFNTNIEITYNANEDLPVYIITFIKNLGGHFTVVYENKSSTITQGAYIICSHFKEIDTFLPDKPTDYISIIIFSEYIEKYLKSYIASLSAHENNKNSGYFYQIKTLTPEMILAMNSLENIQLTSDLKRLYLESKTLELIALFFEQLKKHNNNKLSLSQREHNQILEAKNILDSNIEQPPTIAVLSRKVGLNEYKLRNAFRELFNNTIFGYVQKQRMIIAKKLIEKDELSVSEAGYKIGYSNLSHFARAFKKEFGISPSELKK